ncbi:MAG: FecR domain-containing protein [Verrucomicrobiota bacterium]
MNYFRSFITFTGLLALTVVSSVAAELASAKVTAVTGTVTLYPASGPDRPLKVGDIVKEGDDISATALSNASFVFSNGSTLELEENSSLTFSDLQQESFSGGKTYEQLEADPSKSQTILELNYGTVSGHVKKLKPGSNFSVETILGTAAIRGTIFTVRLNYNSSTGELALIIRNRGGLIDLIGGFVGSGSEYKYTGGEKIVKAIDSLNFVVVRLSRTDPNYEEILEVIFDFFPSDKPPVVIPLPTPVLTPEDPSVIIVSPEGAAT